MDVGEKDTGHGMLSEYDEPGWVIGTISITLKHCMDSIQQKHQRPDEMTRPGWVDVVNSFSEGDIQYGMTELDVPAAGKLQLDTNAPTPAPIKCGTLIMGHLSCMVFATRGLQGTSL